MIARACWNLAAFTVEFLVGIGELLERRRVRRSE